MLVREQEKIIRLVQSQWIPIHEKATTERKNILDSIIKTVGQAVFDHPQREMDTIMGEGVINAWASLYIPRSSVLYERMVEMVSGHWEEFETGRKGGVLYRALKDAGYSPVATLPAAYTETPTGQLLKVALDITSKSWAKVGPPLTEFTIATTGMRSVADFDAAVIKFTDALK